MTTVTTAKRVDKLYKDLSPEQLGTLAYEACLKDDDAEFERIKSAAPRVSYRGIVFEVKERAEALHRMVNFIGINYWRITAIYLGRKIQGGHETWLEQTTTLITFARRVCEITTLDFDLVMRQLDITQDIVDVIDQEIIPADEDLIDEWLSLLEINE